MNGYVDELESLLDDMDFGEFEERRRGAVPARRSARRHGRAASSRVRPRRRPARRRCRPPPAT